MESAALFTNWTDEDFVGYWNGRAIEIKAGKSKYMQDYLARHFAKYLTNRELLRTDKNGNLIYPHGDKCTSPKDQDQVPLYNDLFYKAYTPANIEEGEQSPEEWEQEMEAIHDNMTNKKEVKKTAKVSKKTKTKPKETAKEDDKKGFHSDIEFPDAPKE